MLGKKLSQLAWKAGSRNEVGWRGRKKLSGAKADQFFVAVTRTYDVLRKARTNLEVRSAPYALLMVQVTQATEVCETGHVEVDHSQNGTWKYSMPPVN